MHTSPASPCSSAPVDDLIREAVRIGLDGICLTDHNHVWRPETVDALRQKHGFLVLRGNEIITDQGDVIVFGLERDIQGITRLEDLRAEVLQAGGFMIAAHPFRGFLTFGVDKLGLTPEKAMQRKIFQYVDGVEILNGKVNEEENRFAGQVAQGLGLVLTGGSDAHEVEEVGRYATRLASPVRNEQDLIEALKKGQTAPVAFRRGRNDARTGVHP
ncbi:MAG: PHP domain-containing protein [Deltaproteobacteria bacterium]|nr:PHP domain-containing protein [Deltaproteobacteria bacterium]